MQHRLVKLQCQQILANTNAHKNFIVYMGLRIRNSLKEHFALPLVTSPLKLGRRDRKGGAEPKDWLAEWKDRLSPLTYHLSIRNRAEDCNFLVNAL